MSSNTTSPIDGLGWLIGYIVINLGVTFLNKGLFQNYGWPYPTTLALWHYTCTAIGTILYVRVFRIIPAATLEWSSIAKLLVFSMLFNVNIWISNFSLNLVSMAMHQMIRAFVPGFTVAFSFLILQKTYTQTVLLSLGVIFIGVCMYAVKGELDYTMFGMIVTTMGAALAALKGVVTNLFMVGQLKLHPFDLLTYTTVFSAVQLYVALAMFTDELDHSLAISYEENPDLVKALVMNGLGAFALNIVSFTANKRTSPLAMNIGGISKQVLAIVLGIVLFGTPITGMGVVGVTITCIGICTYARQSYLSKQTATPTQTLPK